MDFSRLDLSRDRPSVVRHKDVSEANSVGVLVSVLQGRDPSPRTRYFLGAEKVTKGGFKSSSLLFCYVRWTGPPRRQMSPICLFSRAV